MYKYFEMTYVNIFSLQLLTLNEHLQIGKVALTKDTCIPVWESLV